MRVIALNRFEYANKLWLPGDEFETTSEKDGELLCLAQQVKPASSRVETRDMKAEQQDNPRRKHYRRRDLRAEE